MKILFYTVVNVCPIFLIWKAYILAYIFLKMDFTLCTNSSMILQTSKLHNFTLKLRFFTECVNCEIVNALLTYKLEGKNRPFSDVCYIHGDMSNYSWLYQLLGHLINYRSTVYTYTHWHEQTAEGQILLKTKWTEMKIYPKNIRHLNM